MEAFVWRGNRAGKMERFPAAGHPLSHWQTERVPCSPSLKAARWAGSIRIGCKCFFRTAFPMGPAKLQKGGASKMLGH